MQYLTQLAERNSDCYDPKESVAKENSCSYDIPPKFRIKKRKFFIEHMTPSPQYEIRSGKWTKEEHQLFLNACKLYGNDWFKVE